MRIFGFFETKKQALKEVIDAPSTQIGMCEEPLSITSAIERPVEEFLLRNCGYFINAICPNCGHTFKKTVLRKTKCSYCGEFACVRTNYINNQQMLLTETQAKAFEIEMVFIWDLKEVLRELEGVNVTEKDLLAELIDMRQESLKYSVDDAIWSCFNKAKLEYIAQGKMSMQRKVDLSMGKELLRQKKHKDALNLFSRIAYMDLNGFIYSFPKGTPWTSLTNDDLEGSCFGPAPAIAEWIVLCLRETKTSSDKYRDIFIKNAKTIQLPYILNGPEIAFAKAWLDIEPLLAVEART
jgi:hypothetical protein